MKKVTITLLLSILSVFALAGQTSKSAIKTAKISSQVLGVEKDYSIYLPAGYEESGKKYPVLYLLHGARNNHRQWPDRCNLKRVADRMIASGMALPMIIVMPDASGETERKEGMRMGYFDKPEWRYETFFFEEFISHIETTYRIESGRQTRAIAGLSMGGGGSMVYALHRPDMFGSCCPLSALMGDKRQIHVKPQHPVYVESILSNDPETMILQGSQGQAEEWSKVRWYLDCGDDDYLIESNIDVFLAMKQKNIPVQMRIRDGAHTSEYWETGLESMLPFISIGFAGGR